MLLLNHFLSAPAASSTPGYCCQLDKDLCCSAVKRAWLETLEHRGWERRAKLSKLMTSRGTQGMEEVVEVQDQVDSQYWMLTLWNPLEFLASWSQWM